MNSLGEFTRRDIAPMIRAEIKRMRGRGCTKSENNIYYAALRKILRN